MLSVRRILWYPSGGSYGTSLVGPVPLWRGPTVPLRWVLRYPSDPRIGLMVPFEAVLWYLSKQSYGSLLVGLKVLLRMVPWYFYMLVVLILH